MTPGIILHAEVLPHLRNNHNEEHPGRFVIVSGDGRRSGDLDLPVPSPSKQAGLQTQTGHFELRLTTSKAVDYRNRPSSLEMPPLCDATQLSASKPNSFICTSCSLPIVQASNIISYRDLPSEHWEELVDAWMCHADQSLHEQVAKRGRGFWPEANQALVGGSYILFEESAIVAGNIHVPEKRKVRFIVSAPKLSFLYLCFSILSRVIKEDQRWLSTDGCPAFHSSAAGCR